MSFDPTLPHPLKYLPPNYLLDGKDFHSLLITAHRELAELKGLNLGVPNPMLLLHPSILTQESVASSEIEDIHTTVEAVLQEELFPESERKTSDKEVLRYREALLWGYDNLKSLGLSTRLIKGIQRILVNDTRSDYRRLQNGIKNQAIGETIYTPPIATAVEELMGNLENFMNDSDEQSDPLLRCAVVHYQFEAIHPFSDGNGRTGRILMVLYLVQKRILNYPNLFISGYLTRRRTEYYERLLSITKSEEWPSYIEFMLHAFLEQARTSKATLADIMEGYYDYKDAISKKHKKIYSADLVEHLFSSPYTAPVRMGKALNVHYTTASKYLAELERGGFLQSKKLGRHHFFANIRLLKALRVP